MARLKVGDHAPDFSATICDGNKIRLADFLGKRALVLFFDPKDGTRISREAQQAIQTTVGKRLKERKQKAAAQTSKSDKRS